MKIDLSKHHEVNTAKGTLSKRNQVTLVKPGEGYNLNIFKKF